MLIDTKNIVVKYRCPECKVVDHRHFEYASIIDEDRLIGDLSTPICQVCKVGGNDIVKLKLMSVRFTLVRDEDAFYDINWYCNKCDDIWTESIVMNRGDSLNKETIDNLSEITTCPKCERKGEKDISFRSLVKTDFNVAYAYG